MAAMLGSSDICGDGGRGAVPLSAMAAAMSGGAPATSSSGARPSRNALQAPTTVVKESLLQPDMKRGDGSWVRRHLQNEYAVHHCAVVVNRVST